jgi:hypothetical protein
MLLKVHMLKSWPQKGAQHKPQWHFNVIFSTNPFKKDHKTQKVYLEDNINFNQGISNLDDCWVHLVAHVDLHIMPMGVISIQASICERCDVCIGAKTLVEHVQHV